MMLGKKKNFVNEDEEKIGPGKQKNSKCFEIFYIERNKVNFFKRGHDLLN
ncbi:MAG: hypothetical protein CM15mP22_6850 [Gammaproteobacteria bacterium]|nr:MAG: hypothetical protein CM15mP22_6850 [Gammaproteobacteria bacterium]